MSSEIGMASFSNMTQIEIQISLISKELKVMHTSLQRPLRIDERGLNKGPYDQNRFNNE
jgi:hypothetical protein